MITTWLPYSYTPLLTSVEKRITGYTDLWLKPAERCEYSHDDLHIFQKPVKNHAGPVGSVFKSIFSHSINVDQRSQLLVSGAGP